MQFKIKENVWPKYKYFVYLEDTVNFLNHKLDETYTWNNFKEEQ